MYNPIEFHVGTPMVGPCKTNVQKIRYIASKASLVRKLNIDPTYRARYQKVQINSTKSVVLPLQMPNYFSSDV